MDSEKKIVPHRVWFTLTGICNNHCTWCLRKGSEIMTFLNFDIIRMAVNVLPKYGVRHCTLTGGEPTLHPQFDLILKELTGDNGFLSYTVITNGRKFAGGIPDPMMGNSKLHVTVSLHGANSRHYFENTGIPQGFDEMIQGIKNLLESGVRCAASVVLGPENLRRVEEYIRLVVSLGIDMLCFTIGIPSLDDPVYIPDPHAVVQAIPAITAYCQKIGLRHCFVLSLPWCFLDDSLLQELLQTKRIMFNCPVPNGNSMVIGEDGAICLCTHTTRYELASREMLISILSDAAGFESFWNSRNLQNLRKEVSVYRHVKCVSCKYRWWCRGGCPLWWRFYDFSECIGR